jgi:hypothetical protein
LKPGLSLSLFSAPFRDSTAIATAAKTRIAEGQRNGSDYLFLIHDNFSHDDYPEYSSVADFELTREKFSHEDVDMQWISQIIPISPAAVEHQKSIGAKRD